MFSGIAGKNLAPSDGSATDFDREVGLLMVVRLRFINLNNDNNGNTNSNITNTSTVKSRGKGFVEIRDFERYCFHSVPPTSRGWAAGGSGAGAGFYKVAV